jgi:NADH-quinone oxidoreductase subunit N
MGWERPVLGIAMWTFMLGFVGFPLTGGFWGKFLVFRAAYEHGWVWLMIVGVVATIVSLYYYLAVVRAVWLRSPAELRLAPAGGSPPRELLLQASVLAALAATVASLVAAQPVIDLARHAAHALPL